MGKQLFITLSIVLLAIGFIVHHPAMAAETSKGDLMNANKFVDHAIELATGGDLTDSQKAYNEFKKNWVAIEDGIKKDSPSAYRDIEANMGKVGYAFTLHKPDQVLSALKDLKTINEKFINGGYPTGGGAKAKNITLDQFILLLQQTKKASDAQNQEQALTYIKKTSDSWLSVEGTVVAHSATVYRNSERDLVTIQAMLTANPPNYQKASQTIESMINYLSPLAAKSGYTYWDAAMILLREGLEALLVVIALLSFVKKSGTAKGKGWVWSGVLSGLGVSIILAIMVKFILSSGAFGHNNELISGWTGVFAAAMLLYMSYWLHSQANIADWNKYIREKSQQALTTGKLVSLGLLAFLAVFREGTETVLFYIGMANQIKLQSLLIGFLIGAAILGLLAYLMINVGLRLPLRPFFIVSSVIVFYLCIKFTGMGIHSLQLAGLIPTTNVESVPSSDFFALYPSLESLIPQLVLIFGAASVLLLKRKGLTAKNS